MNIGIVSFETFRNCCLLKISSEEGKQHEDWRKIKKMSFYKQRHLHSFEGSGGKKTQKVFSPPP